MLAALADAGPYAIVFMFGFALGVLAALTLLAKRWPPNGGPK